VLILNIVFNPQLPMIAVNNEPKKYQTSHGEKRESSYNKFGRNKETNPIPIPPPKCPRRLTTTISPPM